MLGDKCDSTLLISTDINVDFIHREIQQFLKGHKNGNKTEKYKISH